MKLRAHIPICGCTTKSCGCQEAVAMAVLWLLCVWGTLKLFWKAKASPCLSWISQIGWKNCTSWWRGQRTLTSWTKVCRGKEAQPWRRSWHLSARWVFARDVQRGMLLHFPSLREFKEAHSQINYQHLSIISMQTVFHDRIKFREERKNTLSFPITQSYSTAMD